MTTKMKEGIPTKEKRGTSPSHPPTIQRGKSPRPSPSLSKQAPPANRSNSASPSGRNVPNYLKGTASSGPETSSSLDHGKKHSPNETLKPNVSRRRSLDKPLPPSASHVPKTRVSTITRETKKQQPSSPSSARATTSAKPLSGRLSKARSFGEEKAASRSNHVKKVENEARRGLSTKDAITETVDINHANDIAPKKESNALQITPQIVEKEEDLDASITQINKDPKDVNNDIKKEVIVLEDNNSNIDMDSEVEVEDVKIDESSIASKDKNESFDSIEDITEENLNKNEITTEEQGELEPHNISTNMEEEEESSPNEVEATASEEKEVEEVVPTTNVESKEKEEEGEDVETTSVKKDEVKKGGESTSAVKQQVLAHGKRDSVVSNDAIEETATKLREQRVNRVKALAGAFESVMS